MIPFAKHNFKHRKYITNKILNGNLYSTVAQTTTERNSRHNLLSLPQVRWQEEYGNLTTITRWINWYQHTLLATSFVCVAIGTLWSWHKKIIKLDLKMHVGMIVGDDGARMGAGVDSHERRKHPLKSATLSSTSNSHLLEEATTNCVENFSLSSSALQ